MTPSGAGLAAPVGQRRLASCYGLSQTNGRRGRKPLRTGEKPCQCRDFACPRAYIGTI